MPTIKATARRVDKGWQRIQNFARSHKFDRSYVKAGVTGTKAAQVHPAEEGAPPSTLTNAMLATTHEYGTEDGRIPARPFVNASFRQHRSEYLAMLTNLVRDAVYQGKITYPRALALIGQKMAADMKMFVRNQDPNWAPLAPSTIRRKLKKALALDYNRGKHREELAAGVKKLIDTGRMLGSITYVVVERSSDGGPDRVVTSTRRAKPIIKRITKTLSGQFKGMVKSAKAFSKSRAKAAKASAKARAKASKALARMRAKSRKGRR